MNLCLWLAEKTPRITSRWLAEVKARGGTWGRELNGLMEEFLGFLTSVVPVALGPHREPGQLIWQQASQLFGSLGAMRGLAAGEIIEEFQFLREIIIRFLYAEPPEGTPDILPMRDALSLNRILDMGVTHASVGHTDALFFALFQGTGAPGSLSNEVLEEFHDQLSILQAELRVVVPNGVAALSAET